MLIDLSLSHSTVLNSTAASAPKHSAMKIGRSIGSAAVKWSTCASLKAADSNSRHMINLSDTGTNIASISIYSVEHARLKSRDQTSALTLVRLILLVE